MRRALFGEEPQPVVLRAIVKLQNRDGGFPCHMSKEVPSCIRTTLNALRNLDALGMLESPAADRAFDYLLASQKQDGGWDEQAYAVKYSAPPWGTPGDLRARLYLTASAAYWLAARGHTVQHAYRDALGFLLRHQDKSGKIKGFLHNTWIAASVFMMAGDQYAQAASRSLQVLMEQSILEWVDSQICWALGCLGRAGLPRGHPFVEAYLAELVRRQGPDGAWASEDGEAHMVGATVEALVVLKHFGLLVLK